MRLNPSYTDPLQLFGFSSAKKMSSCVVRTANSYRVYNKGAAEWVLQRCTSMFSRLVVGPGQDGDDLPSKALTYPPSPAPPSRQ